MKQFLSLVFFLATFCALHAQGQIQGTVTDANGKPVIGAKISEVGGTGYAFTNLNGQYTLRYSNLNPVLSISSDGYTAKSLKLADLCSTNIKLERQLSNSQLALGQTSTRQVGFFKRIFGKKAENCG